MSARGSSWSSRTPCPCFPGTWAVLVWVVNNVCWHPAWTPGLHRWFGARHLATEVPLQKPLTFGTCGRQLPSVSISLLLLLLNAFSPPLQRMSCQNSLEQSTKSTPALGMLCGRLWPLASLDTDDRKENLSYRNQVIITLSNYLHLHIQDKISATTRRLQLPSPLPSPLPCWAHSCAGTCPRSWVCCCCYSAWCGDSCCCAILCSSLAIGAALSYVRRSWSSVGDMSRSWQRRTRMHLVDHKEPPWLVTLIWRGLLLCYWTTFWHGWSNWRAKLNWWSTPPPLTPPIQQGVSLLLLPLPSRKLRNRTHLAATQGLCAFTHTSLIGLGNIKEHSFIDVLKFFFFSTSHFSSIYHWCNNIRLMKSNRKTYGHPETLYVGCVSEMFGGKKKDFFMLCPMLIFIFFYQDYLAQFYIFPLLILFDLNFSIFYNVISGSCDCKKV